MTLQTSPSPVTDAGLHKGYDPLSRGVIVEYFPSLCLQNGDQIDCLHVGFILLSVMLRKLAFIGLAREIVEPRLKPRIGSQGSNLTSNVGREAYVEAVVRPSACGAGGWSLDICQDERN